MICAILDHMPMVGHSSSLSSTHADRQSIHSEPDCRIETTSSPLQYQRRKDTFQLQRRRMGSSAARRPDALTRCAVRLPTYPGVGCAGISEDNRCCTGRLPRKVQPLRHRLAQVLRKEGEKGPTLACCTPPQTTCEPRRATSSDCTAAARGITA